MEHSDELCIDGVRVESVNLHQAGLLQRRGDQFRDNDWGRRQAGIRLSMGALGLEKFLEAEPVYVSDEETAALPGFRNGSM